MNFSIGSTHFKVSIGTLLGLAFGLFLFFRFGQGGSAALDRWLGSAPQERAVIRKLLARDALHRVQASRARRQLSDSLDTVLQVVKAQQEAGAALLGAARTAEQFRAAAQVIAANAQVCVDGLTLCKVRGDSLARADSAHTDSLRHALQAADTSLAQGVAAAECHLVHLGPLKLLRCPSRTTAFKVGVVGGVGVVEVLRLLFTGKL